MMAPQFRWPEDRDTAADDLLRRCPPPPLTDEQTRTVVAVWQNHLADQARKGVDHDAA